MSIQQKWKWIDYYMNLGYKIFNLYLIREIIKEMIIREIIIMFRILKIINNVNIVIIEIIDYIIVNVK